MRLPDKDAPGCGGALRSLDTDVSPWCDACGLPLMLFEVTRQRTGHKGYRYTQTMAKKLGVPAYLIRHSLPDDELISVESLTTYQVNLVPAKSFVKWVEKKFAKHMKEKHGG